LTQFLQKTAESGAAIHANQTSAPRIYADVRGILSLLKTSLVIIACWAFCSFPAYAQTPSPWQDDLADHLAGTWKMAGQVMGHPGHHDVQAEWVLNHQFLRIHEKTSADALASESRYEAIWFLGYDATSEKYVLHLLDLFGTRYSETLGYGVREGNDIRFVFEYPDGPFHTTFRWLPEKDSWQWLMEQKSRGKWTPFADLTLTRVKKSQ
jgi:hypothetical protein